MLLKRILCELKTGGKKVNVVVVVAFHYNKDCSESSRPPPSSQPPKQAFVCRGAVLKEQATRSN